MSKARQKTEASNSVHARISAILKLEEASGLSDFAQYLALDTDLGVKQAQGALAACHRDIARNKAVNSSGERHIPTPFDRMSFDTTTQH